LFIFGKRGETLVPARDLDTTQFTQIDIRQVTEIPLPDSSAEYLIASRQNLDGLASGDGDMPQTVSQAMDDSAFRGDSAYQSDSAYQRDSLMYRPDSAQVTPPVQDQAQQQPEQENGDDAEKSEAEKQKEKGRVRGTLRIAEPQEFWKPSKFLIIVRT
jgi:hypothetical protein